MRTLHITDQPIHITYRLYGSIPNLPLQQLHHAHQLKRLRAQRALHEVEQRGEAHLLSQHRKALQQTELDHYLQYDQLLDYPTGGPQYLAGPDEKALVISSWQTIATLHGLHPYAISVMDNHVHVLVESKHRDRPVSLPLILEKHKRYTGRLLNQLHQTPGRRVWAEKEYSRTVRSGCFEQVLWYVLNNPVKAGITKQPLRWVGNWWAEELYETFIAARVA